jgi:3',5'-cyclic-AMP phosphodiesterase
VTVVEPELTTVADDEAVVHVGPAVRRYRGLSPATDYDLDGLAVRTLPRPGGDLLAVVATVNDVHFGETECGLVEGTDIGPVLRSQPGEPPYPETMNAAAIAEIRSLRAGAGPDAVVAKGDLTTHGSEDEYGAFLRHYGSAFGDRLHHVRGNHDAQHGATFADAPVQEVMLEGVTLAIVDTTIPGRAGGRLTVDQLQWLDELGARADRAVLVFGHHHPWDPASSARPVDYFGINPDDSQRLIEVLGRRDRFAGYFAGHTHRNRARQFAGAPGLPLVEVASVKDFPGSWAEYRIFDGGILQVHRRVSSPAALAWTDRTRAMFHGAYAAYSFGTIHDRCLPLKAAGH